MLIAVLLGILAWTTATPEIGPDVLTPGGAHLWKGKRREGKLVVRQMGRRGDGGMLQMSKQHIQPSLAASKRHSLMTRVE